MFKTDLDKVEIESNIGNFNNEVTTTKDVENSPNGQVVITIIIDCSKMSVIDVMGINALKKVSAAYKFIGADLVVAGCSNELTNKLLASGIVRAERQQEETDDKNMIHMKMYPTVHDAVVSSQINTSH